jgi:hypothetical protein
MRLVITGMTVRVRTSSKIPGGSVINTRGALRSGTRQGSQVTGLPATLATEVVLKNIAVFGR